jgi:hypothetical protein
VSVLVDCLKAGLFNDDDIAWIQLMRRHDSSAKLFILANSQAVDDEWNFLVDWIR